MVWWLIYFLIFVLGLCIGSFLNVLIYRLPRGLSITGRSFCPKCRKKISWYDNIPLVSFILLREKCRFCHSPISWQYPLVELVMGGLFVLITGFVIRGTQYVISWQSVLLITYCLFLISSLIVIFVIDLKHEVIPDSVVYPAILLSFPYSILYTSYPIHSAVISSFFFLLLYLVTRGRGMGFGDVKLAFLIGLVLGFPNSILAFYLAFLTGALVGVILILARKKRLGEHVPFGPFLVSATMVSLFWGTEIIKWFTARLF